MRQRRLENDPSVDTKDAVILENIRRFEAECDEPSEAAVTEPSGSIAAADQAELEREIVAIERAAAALRRAEPALESWANAPSLTLQKPRSVWLLVAVLWLSTALVTIGAAVAISALVG